VTPHLVSIILPVYNRPSLLREAVDQCIAQSYRPIEIIIIDDGSTDGTGQMADKLKSRHKEVRHSLHQDNLGPGAAREAGRGRASGEFLQYFDSDDRIDSDKIAIQVAALRSQPSAGVAYCRTREYHRGRESEWTCSQQTGELLNKLFPRLLSGCCWPTITPLIRRSVSDTVGAWTSLRQEEDWEYDSRIAAQGVELVACEQYLADSVLHTQARASDNASKDPRLLRDRAKARLLILDRAVAAGIPKSQPDMENFAAGTFLLARQCGLAGLEESSRLLTKAAASVATKGRLLKIIVFQISAATLGYRKMSRIATRQHPA